jgi:hypothetical protein
MILTDQVFTHLKRKTWVKVTLTLFKEGGRKSLLSFLVFYSGDTNDPWGISATIIY